MLRPCLQTQTFPARDKGEAFAARDKACVFNNPSLTASDREFYTANA
jgi:hypothetical protein